MTEVIFILSVKDFTNQELLEQILNAEEDLDSLKYGTADYNAALSEIIVAKIELARRTRGRREHEQH